MNQKHILALLLASQAAFVASTQGAATVIPPGYAMPAGTVDTNQPGFLVRPYQTDATSAGSLAWTEDQLAGFHGPNLADTSGADTNGYYTVSSVVNWNISVGGTVDTFPPADAFPGISGSAVNFSEEVLTYIQFPAAGTYTLGVNSDDGFSLGVANINPKDHFTATVVGQFNATRSPADTTFDVSVATAGIYPFRLVYWQAGGGASASWFSVVTNNDSTTSSVLINDSSTPGALAAFSSANIATPYVASFSHNPTGFTVTIQDDLTALDPNSLHVKLNSVEVSVTSSKVGRITTVGYTATTLIAPGVTNNLTITFADNAPTPHQQTATLTYTEPSYSAIPSSAALTADAIDTTKPGFLYRLSQIDSTASGVLGANIAHGEAQLAGLLADPSGNIYPNIATPGEQPDGSFVVSGVINFSVGGTDLGAFTAANGQPDAAFPGLPGDSGDNLAGEIVTYLDLKPGYYSFAVNSADGFRVTAAANPYDVFGTPLGIFDFRRIPTETQFGVAVQNAGIYPVRIAFFRQGSMADNSGNAELEFYTVNKDGSKILVNDSSNTNAVKAYWKRTAAYGPFVKYAGPTSFVSPFNGPDVGFTNINVVISDGSTAKVDPSTAALTIDGSAVTITRSSTNGLTTLTYTPPQGLQLPRTVHSASVTFKDTAPATLTNTVSWSFNLLRNYVLPAPLFFEDFESTPTAADPDTQPAVPDGWVAENHTGVQNDVLDPGDLNSDFYLGWVVVDKSFGPQKDIGVSAFTPQILNGVAFSEDTNPLLSNHYMRAETDSRQNGPPGQIQYVTTKPYDLSGKTGIVVAFNSSYEQNQDNINGLEVTTDGGTTWSPVFYWIQDGFDSQGTTDIIRDGLGKIDVSTTMLTSYGDVARYTNNGALVGGYYGFFLKVPVTDAIAPYIEGRVNDDGSESKRIELFRIPQADNKSNVQFRFIQAATSSWYWAIDNWGVYSVPSGAQPAPPGPLSAAIQNDNKVVISWPGSGTLQSTANVVTGPWQDIPTATSPFTPPPGTGDQQFYRLKN